MARRERIGAMLLRWHLVAEEDLDRALAAQSVHGGRIGTNLVELGVLTLDDLARCLSDQLHFPAASHLDLHGAPREVLDLVSKEMCSRYKVFPLALHEGRVLKLAMLDPDDLQMIDELSFQLGKRIRPVVVPEARLVHALEQRYGIPRERRFLSVPGEAKASTTSRGGRTPPPAAPKPLEEPDPEPELVFLDAVPRPKPPGGDDFELTVETPAEPEADFEVVVDWIEAGPPRTSAIEVTDLQQALTALGEAQDRRTVLDMLVHPPIPAVSLAVVFLVKGEMAVGLCASGTPVSADEVRGLVVSLSSPSLLQRAVAERQLCAGPVATDPMQQMISRYLRAKEPREAQVVPVTVGARVVNLVCVQTDAGEGFAADAAATLRVLCDAAAESYRRIIVNQRTGGSSDGLPRAT